jgi:hypothetical protein
MKKLVIFIASLVVLLVASSAFGDKRQEAALGAKTPTLVVSAADTTLSVESLKGSWVILTFWSAADAQSRVALHDVVNYMRQRPTDNQAVNNVAVVSVNFDRSSQLMREIMRIDNTDNYLPFRVDNDEAEASIRRAYRMNEGLRTFLINPEGVLIAADPSEDTLRSILG